MKQYNRHKFQDLKTQANNIVKKVTEFIRRACYLNIMMIKIHDILKNTFLPH